MATPNKKPAVLSPEQARTIISEELLPLLPGCNLHRGLKPSTSPDGLLIEFSTTSLGVRFSENAPDLFELSRAHRFFRSEKELVRRFLRAVKRISTYREHFFWTHALVAAVRRSIVQTLDYPNESLLLRVLAEFEAMASQTYEGHRIAVALGLDDHPAVQVGVQLEEMWGEDFGKVLTGNLETILTVSSDGYVSRLRDLRRRDVDLPHAPFHARHIADWCSGRQIVVYLNRNGEILIFREKTLRFAWRRGRWHHFVHFAILRQLDPIENEELRRCLYETFLDISFARSGGCIGVVMSEHRNLLRKIVNADDRLGHGDTPKTKILTQAIEEYGTHFQEIPRRLRQALAAIDGALIMDARGTLLAAGAIVAVDGGSDAGGRKAAARSIAKMGMGFKISADGPVTGFEGRGTAKSVREIFKFG